MPQQPLSNGQGLLSLWLNWVIGVGMLSFLVMVSLWTRPSLMPLLAFGMQFILYLIVRKSRKDRLPVCYLLLFIVSRILFWTGLIELVVDIMYSHHIIDFIFEAGTVNHEIPFITILIVSPATVVVSLWAKIKWGRIGFCRECKLRYGTSTERGFLGWLFSQEGRYQNLLLLNIASFLSIVSWVYYAIVYVNSDLNLPDQITFVWIPTFLFVFSTAYLGIRYISLWKFYNQNVDGSIHRHGTSTELRYLIIWDNRLCLKLPSQIPDKELDPADAKIDTPASLVVHYRERMTDADSEFFLKGMTGMKNPRIRFMYQSNTASAICNTFHYICMIDDEDKEILLKRYPECEFFTLHEVDAMTEDKMIKPMLAVEIYRLYTITMAWKAYYRDGRRRYPMKNYSPTFRLCDVMKWNVDYSDTEWLRVAVNNQDKPFFRLRKWWKKYVNGIYD